MFVYLTLSHGGVVTIENRGTMRDTKVNTIIFKQSHIPFTLAVEMIRRAKIMPGLARWQNIKSIGSNVSPP